MWERKQFFECACHSSEHTVSFAIDEYAGDAIMYFEVQLIQWKPWYKRIWPAIKHLFNIKPSCGHWDCWQLNCEDIARLKSMLNYMEEKDKQCLESIELIAKNGSNNTVN